MGESITCVQGATDCLSAGRKVDREYMERLADREDCKLISRLGVRMAKRVVEAQQTYFEVCKVMINQCMSGWDNRLKDLKQKLALGMSGRVMLTDDLMERGF